MLVKRDTTGMHDGENEVKRECEGMSVQFSVRKMTR